LYAYIRGVAEHYATDPDYAVRSSNSPTAHT